jgi:hypothetical protein
MVIIIQKIIPTHINRKRLLTFTAILMILISTIITIQSFAGQGLPNRTVIWDATLHISGENGIYDKVVFGEALDANDGLPPDNYDIPKPPIYLPPFIRAWFTNNLTPPYDSLAQDYRIYPDHEKTWNLYIQWTPNDYSSPTTITITWNNTHLQQSKYNHIMLCTLDNKPLQDMLITNSYSFDCPAMIPQHFIIYATSTTYYINTQLTGNGIISISPQQTSYFPGTSVQIRAIPQIDWVFNHWTGDIIGTNTTQYMQMTSDKNIQAHFILNDTTPPQIQILRPLQGFYLQNRLIHRFHINRKSIIFGTIQIEISVSDSQTQVTSIDLYIDEELHHNSTTHSLMYSWEGKFQLFNHRHTIKIIASDENGNIISEEVDVYKYR